MSPFQGRLRPEEKRKHGPSRRIPDIVRRETCWSIPESIDTLSCCTLPTPPMPNHSTDDAASCSLSGDVQNTTWSWPHAAPSSAHSSPMTASCSSRLAASHSYWPCPSYREPHSGALTERNSGSAQGYRLKQPSPERADI